MREPSCVDFPAFTARVLFRFRPEWTDFPHPTPHTMQWNKYHQPVLFLTAFLFFMHNMMQALTHLFILYYYYYYYWIMGFMCQELNVGLWSHWFSPNYFVSPISLWPFIFFVFLITVLASATAVCTECLVSLLLVFFFTLNWP